MFNRNVVVSSVLLTLMSTSVLAGPIGITQFSLFVNAPQIDAVSFQDDQLGDFVFIDEINDFGDGGFDVSFTNGLDVNNLGTVTWSVTNNSSIDLTDGAQIFGFLDADLGLNETWNEYGETVGLIDDSYDSWEIDGPESFWRGDMKANLLGGTLDNFNNVPQGDEEDVSLALGFDVANWLIGETYDFSFSIAAIDPGIAGFKQVDLDTGDEFYFTRAISSASVPEPGTLGLLSMSLLLLGVTRRKFILPRTFC